MPGWTPIHDRCYFTLTGADRTRYLNGQVTNQVENLPADTARYACVTNRKGKLEADLFVTAWPDKGWLMLESARALQEDLFARLDRYIIADDAELIDVTEHWQTYHILTDDNTAKLASSVPHCRAANANRFGIAGIDVTLPTSEALAYEHILTDTLGPPDSQELLEHQRIAAGIAKWGAELTSGLLPPEARLEHRAIDYTKGCYTGQEVISRIKMAGKVNRLLNLFTVEATENAPAPGDDILTNEDISKVVGTITSVTLSRDEHGERLALGYLKSHHANAGNAFTTRSHEDGNRTSQITLQPFPKHDS